MLIVVSGTHASGKSTLISDFALHHPEAAVGGDVFDLVAQDDDHASARMFATQLRVAADRILATPAGELTILERGPLDFLAYLLAVEQRGRDGIRHRPRAQRHAGDARYGVGERNGPSRAVNCQSRITAVPARQPVRRET